MTFGEYLKRQRETKGWTQPDAAAKAAIEQSYLSKLETGKSYPSEDVFGRLVEAFDLDIGAMADAVGSSELSRLREISDVRTYLLDQQSKSKKASRGWLVASLIMLMTGGASLGLSTLAEDSEQPVFRYKSYGVLAPDEPVDAFDRIYNRSSGSDEAVAAAEQKRSEMTARLNIIEVEYDTFRGHRYLEDVEGGRRKFELAHDEIIRTPSPLRWFFVPALAFLMGSAGCFLVSFRWR